MPDRMRDRTDGSPTPRRADREFPSPTRRRDLQARSEQSTVNPYIWYLHRCKISTGCATKMGSCPQDATSCPPVVHIRIHKSVDVRSAQWIVVGVHRAIHRVVNKSSTDDRDGFRSGPIRPTAASSTDGRREVCTCDVRSVVTRTPGSSTPARWRTVRRSVAGGPARSVRDGSPPSRIVAVGRQAQRRDRAVQPEQGHRRCHPGLSGPAGRPDAVAQLAQQVEETVRGSGQAEVQSQDVGLAILGPLRDLDEVAYLRFASVYRSFTSAEDFAAEIRDMRSACRTIGAAGSRIAGRRRPIPVGAAAIRPARSGHRRSASAEPPRTTGHRRSGARRIGPLGSQ